MGKSQVAEIDERNLTILLLCSNGLTSEKLISCVKCDVIMFIGGNPYYLLMSLRKSNAKPILREISKNKCLIGWSAGALVLCPTIKIIDEYSPEMNLWGLDDLTGMEITDIEILPHHDKFLSRYEGFEEKCHEYEVRNRCKVFRINYGEGIIIENGSISFT